MYGLPQGVGMFSDLIFLSRTFFITKDVRHHSWMALKLAEFEHILGQGATDISIAFEENSSQERSECLPQWNKETEIRQMRTLCALFDSISLDSIESYLPFFVDFLSTRMDGEEKEKILLNSMFSCWPYRPKFKEEVETYRLETDEPDYELDNGIFSNFNRVIYEEQGAFSSYPKQESTLFPTIKGIRQKIRNEITEGGLEPQDLNVSLCGYRRQKKDFFTMQYINDRMIQHLSSKHPDETLDIHIALFADVFENNKTSRAEFVVACPEPRRCWFYDFLEYVLPLDCTVRLMPAITNYQIFPLRALDTRDFISQKKKNIPDFVYAYAIHFWADGIPLAIYDLDSKSYEALEPSYSKMSRNTEDIWKYVTRTYRWFEYIYEPLFEEFEDVLSLTTFRQTETPKLDFLLSVLQDNPNTDVHVLQKVHRFYMECVRYRWLPIKFFTEGIDNISIGDWQEGLGMGIKEEIAEIDTLISGMNMWARDIRKEKCIPTLFLCSNKNEAIQRIQDLCEKHFPFEKMEEKVDRVNQIGWYFLSKWWLEIRALLEGKDENLDAEIIVHHEAYKATSDECGLEKTKFDSLADDEAMIKIFALCTGSTIPESLRWNDFHANQGTFHLLWKRMQEIEQREFSSYGVSEQDFTLILPNDAFHETFRLPILLYIECYVALYNLHEQEFFKYGIDWGIEQYINGILHLPSIFVSTPEQVKTQHAQLDTNEEYQYRLLTVAFHKNSGPRDHSVVWYLKRMLQMIQCLQLSLGLESILNISDHVMIRFQRMIMELSYIPRDTTKGVHSLFESAYTGPLSGFIRKNPSYSVEKRQGTKSFHETLSFIIAQFESTDDIDIQYLASHILLPYSSNTDEIPF